MMDPNSYQNQAAQSQTTQPQPQSQPPVNDWFNAQPTTPTPPPKRPINRFAIIIAVVVLTISGAAAAVFLPQKLASTNDTSTSCFAVSNYQDLVTLIKTVDDDQISMSDVKPQKLLYTHYVRFLPTTTTVDTDASEGTNAFLQELGEYYTTKQPSAPIVIHINASFSSTDSVSLVRQQITKVYQTLVDAGFGTKYIVTNEPVLTLKNDDFAFEESNTVLVSIAPSVDCEAKGSQ